MICIKTINETDPQRGFNEELKELEAAIEYPYGNDFFKIDHGASYFRFFDRLGAPYFHVAQDGKKLVACGCGIIRSIPIHNRAARAWYLCDLKVHPKYRRQGLTKRLFRKNLLLNYLKCPRGYTISMNPATGTNPVVEVIKKLFFLPINFATTLHFFELSKSQAKEMAEEISKIIGKPVKFLSLEGIKDIVLKSSGKPLPIFHAQYGPLASSNATDIKDEGTYMFCAPEGSTLCALLSQHFTSSASASVLEHRMGKQNWDFILSSDV